MITSPNMALPIPQASIDAGPAWATEIQNSLTIIDAHTHASGSGVPITPSGLNINADLTFNSHNLTSVNSVAFSTESGTLTTLSIYSDGTDLYYKDASSNLIQITKSGGVNVSAGNIQNLPSSPAGAGISWQNAQGTFQFTGASAALGANLDAGTLVIRYPGSYPTPSGNYIAIQAPTALATGYAYTLPTTLPSSGAINAYLLTSTTGGIISYTTVDNSTLTQTTGGSPNVISVKDGGITTAKIGSLQVTTALIANLAVTAAKIANTTITSAQIASATITGTQIASNVALAGKTVNAGSQNVIVSNTNAATNGLSLIRGQASTNGGPVSGEGFGITALGTGQCRITYNTTFLGGDVPIPVAIVAADGYYITVHNIFNSSFDVILKNTNTGVATDQTFTFIVIGQRA